MTTSEIKVDTDAYDNDFKAVVFSGPTDQSVFAAAAEWCSTRERDVIIRAVNYDVYAPRDENDCALTVIYEPFNQIVAGSDVQVLREAWPQFLAAVTKQNRLTGAMVNNAEISRAQDRAVVLTHPALPLARRLAAPHHLEVLQAALTTVLGAGWSVSIDGPFAAEPETRPMEPPLPTVASADEADDGGQPHPAWLDSHQGQRLESWIEISPTAICGNVRVRGDSRSASASAFWAVNHTTRCDRDAPCNTILRLADESRFKEAGELAEHLVLV